MDFRTSVRALVEFVYRNGDYDRTRGTSEEAMLQGTRIHKMIQSRQGVDYEPEVPLSFIHEGKDYNIRLDGRADGIITQKDGFTIDEIKGTYRDVDRLNSPQIEHIAQAACYAYMYGVDKPEAVDIKVRITYCNMDTEIIKYFIQSYTREELSAWFEDTVSRYRKFLDISFQNSQKAAKSIERLPFPYPYREGQKELMGQVYSTIRHEKKLFLQAPTGTGKTLATVYPSLKALGLGHAGRIFYLTARTTGANMASDTLEILRNNGLFMSSIELSSRERICFMDKPDCDPAICPYAKGHFDRVNQVLYGLIADMEAKRAVDIAKAAKEGLVCPFELGLDAALFSGFIICDYNYVFDPRARLQRFFGEGTGKDNIFLIDEAHNLLERGREMYSASVNSMDISNLRKIFIHRDKRISAGTGRVKKILESLSPEGDYSYVTVTDALLHELNLIFDRIGSFFERVSREKRLGHVAPGDGITPPEMDSVLEFYFNLSHFLDMYDNMDGDYCVYTVKEQQKGVILELFCVNPAKSLEKSMEKAVSTILFSATLLPIQYYKSLLGGQRGDYEVYARSSFDPERLGVLIGKDVTTRYRDRGEKLYRTMASYINRACGEKKGNYMVFFPSYRFMQDVYDVYRREFQDGETECLVQSANMDEAERKEFLNRFNLNGDTVDFPSGLGMEVEVEDKSLIGFCIMGSIFSEGIDLTGDSLIGIIIVGPGTPMVCTQREILKTYFDKDGNKGFDYAYKYPGMNKVLQSAGRLIRTAEDAGFVLLLDERFLTAPYKSLFPREWKNPEVADINSVKEKIGSFWMKL